MRVEFPITQGTMSIVGEPGGSVHVTVVQLGHGYIREPKESRFRLSYTDSQRLLSSLSLVASEGVRSEHGLQE